MEKPESWAQRTRDHMQAIKNKYCFLLSLSWMNVVFITQASAFLKKSHCQILVSFHFKSETCPSFSRPLWNQRRQGQSTEGQKLGFFLLLSLRFTTVREFPASHWCLVPCVIAGKGAGALCLLMLVSYQSPEEHLQHLQGQQRFWRRGSILPQDTQSSPVSSYLISASPCPVWIMEMMFPFPPSCVFPVIAVSSRSCLEWQ